MLTVRTTGIEAAAAKHAGLKAAMHAELLATVQRETLALQRHVVEDKLSGQVLNVRTGTLRRSITQEVKESPGVIVGSVGTNLGYGLAHEFGATIQHPGSVARRAKALHWVAAGQDVFAAWTRPHTIKLPERSFLRSALADRRDAFITAVKEAIRRVLSVEPKP
jgi:phage gpG-like protein